MIEPLLVDVLFKGDLYAIEQVLAVYYAGTAGFGIGLIAVVALYEKNYFSLGNASLRGISGAVPGTEAAGAGHSGSSKGGSHGENHDQS